MVVMAAAVVVVVGDWAAGLDDGLGLMMGWWGGRTVWVGGGGG